MYRLIVWALTIAGVIAFQTNLHAFVVWMIAGRAEFAEGAGFGVAILITILLLYSKFVGPIS